VPEADLPGLAGIDFMSGQNVYFGTKMGHGSAAPHGKEHEIQWPMGTKLVQCRKAASGHWLLVMSAWEGQRQGGASSSSWRREPGGAVGRAAPPRGSLPTQKPTLRPSSDKLQTAHLATHATCVSTGTQTSASDQLVGVGLPVLASIRTFLVGDNIPLMRDMARNTRLKMASSAWLSLSAQALTDAARARTHAFGNPDSIWIHWGRGTVRQPILVQMSLRNRLSRIIRRQCNRGVDVLLEAAARHLPHSGCGEDRDDVSIFTCGLGDAFCEHFQMVCTAGVQPVQCRRGCFGSITPDSSKDEATMCGIVLQHLMEVFSSGAARRGTEASTSSVGAAVGGSSVDPGVNMCGCGCWVGAQRRDWGCRRAMPRTAAPTASPSRPARQTRKVWRSNGGNTKSQPDRTCQ